MVDSRLSRRFTSLTSPSRRTTGSSRRHSRSSGSFCLSFDSHIIILLTDDSWGITGKTPMRTSRRSSRPCTQTTARSRRSRRQTYLVVVSDLLDVLSVSVSVSDLCANYSLVAVSVIVRQFSLSFMIHNIQDLRRIVDDTTRVASVLRVNSRAEAGNTKLASCRVHIQTPSPTVDGLRLSAQHQLRCNA